MDTAIAALRDLVREELSAGDGTAASTNTNIWHVFPVLDDYELRRRCQLGEVPVWPRARCMLDDGSIVDLAVVEEEEEHVGEDVIGQEEEDPSVSATTDNNSTTTTTRPLSQLVDDFFFLCCPRTEEPQKTPHPLAAVASATTPSSSLLRAALERIYSSSSTGSSSSSIDYISTKGQLGSALRKSHAGFVDCLGVVECRSSPHKRYIVLFRGNELSLRSFTAFNRHALRREHVLGGGYYNYGNALLLHGGAGGGSHSEVSSPTFAAASPNNNNNAFFSSSSTAVASSSSSLDDKPPQPPPPFLLGSDPLTEGECDDLPARFLFYQAARALLHATRHGQLSLDALTLTPDFWLQLLPPLPTTAPPRHTSSPFHIQNDTLEWRCGRMSNFDYLMNVNYVAGRRTAGVGQFHAILPWVLDFDVSSSLAYGHARDLTRSKYRLKKGERQLQATYASGASFAAATAASFSSSFTSSNGALPPPPHHVPESLSELTYYMYASRNTPLCALQRIVRPSFEPKEYPGSLARLYEWTPDECVPEFFVDRAVLLPSPLGLRCLVCGGGGGGSVDDDADDHKQHVQEARAFLQDHMRALETCDRAGLARWIDLHFGAHLQGRLAVDSLNVVLSASSSSSAAATASHHLPSPLLALRRTPDFVRVFGKPHPEQLASSSSSSPPSSAAASSATATARDDSSSSTTTPHNNIFLSQVLLAMLAPRGGLKLIQSELKNSTFLGSDLVEWLLQRNLAGVDSASDAVALAQRMMAAGYFLPEAAVAAATAHVDGGVGEFDFVDADDCAYTFRLGDRKWNHHHHHHSHSTTSSGSTGKLDLGDAKQDVMAAFRAQQMSVDAEVSGLMRACSYYSGGGGGGDDAAALALVMGELYLGRPVCELADLDALPLPVARALRRALQNSAATTSSSNTIQTWLRDTALFPAHFAVAYDFIAAVRLAADNNINNKDDDAAACALFASDFSAAFAPVQQRHSDLANAASRKALVEAAWLTFPLAARLVQTRPERLRDVFTAMHRVLGDEPAFKSFVDALVLGGGGASSHQPMPCEFWVNVLPVDAYLEHFVDAYAANGQDTSAALERALLTRADNLRRVGDLLSARLPAHAPVFRALTRETANRAAATATAHSSSLWVPSSSSSSSLSSSLATATTTLLAAGAAPPTPTTAAGVSFLVDFDDSAASSVPPSGASSAAASANTSVTSAANMDDDSSDDEAAGGTVVGAVGAATGEDLPEHSPPPPQPTQPLLAPAPTAAAIAPPSQPPSPASATTTTTSKRNIQFRFLAHADAPVTCMANTSSRATAFSSSAVDVTFATGSRKGEVALWRYCPPPASSDAAAQSTPAASQPSIISLACRFKASDDAVRSLRLVNSRSLLVGTARNNVVAMFDLQDDSAVRATTWIPNVRCAEPLYGYAGSDDSVMALGETTGDVSLADFRTAKAHLFARFALPVPSGNVVRALCTSGYGGEAPSIVCSVNDRVFELDVRMVGRVCREWQAGSTVTRLFAADRSVGGGGVGARRVVGVMKAGNVASVWDLSPVPSCLLSLGGGGWGSMSSSSSSGGGAGASASGATGGGGGEVKTRLRALAGFSDPYTKLADVSQPGAPVAAAAEELDSLAAVSEDGASAMYVVRGGHKISRVPLAVPDDPREVRVTPLSLTHVHPILGVRRYKPGNLCLSAVSVLPGHVVLVAGHEPGSKPFSGSYVHMVT